MVTAADYEAFWSYAHEDNDRQHGRVLSLAQAIGDEFAVTTGNDLKIFVDRENLAWGELWRDRIDRALGQVPFFIAIVTPKYVKSPECRRELLAFNREAKSRDIGRLLLPILFINVKELDEKSDDEVLALIARTQYVDWRDLRLKDAGDPEVLRAINALALRMETLLGEVSETTKEIEARSDAEQFDSLSDIVDRIHDKLPGWMDAVEFDHVEGRRWRSTVEERVSRIKRLLRSRQSGGPVLATYKRLGADLLPIALSRLEKAKNYARLTIDLDPLVTGAIRYVSERPELAYVLDELTDGVNEAVLNIEPPVEKHNWTIPPEAARYSKSADEARDAIAQSVTFVTEGNEIVLQWRDGLATLDGPESGSGAPATSPDQHLSHRTPNASLSATNRGDRPMSSGGSGSAG